MESAAAPAPSDEPIDALAAWPPAMQQTIAMPAVEPPASGFVQSVALGEMVAPDIDADEVELVEPLEFELPGFDALGEREIDTDIEEID